MFSMPFSHSYSIDTFANHSSIAVSRTPTNPAIITSSYNDHQDEELFRDLFAGDNESEPSGTFNLKQQKLHQQNRNASTLPWVAGATQARPFNQLPPSLASVAPPLNLAELMTARPGDSGDPSHAVGWPLRELDQVVEEGADEDRPETDQESLNRKAKRKVPPASPGLRLKSHSPVSVQHEALSFLEKLDLKSLLCTPRPDVTNFYPTNRPPALGNNVGAHPPPSTQCVQPIFTDFRVEEDRKPVRPIGNLNGTVKSARKEPPAPDVSSRLAHMELTYGTTAAGPRRARKETFKRLSNPIIGHSSTLEALSPEQRKKRYDSSGLTENLYEVTAASAAMASAYSPNAQQKATRSLSNQDEHDSHSQQSTSGVGTNKSAPGRRQKDLDERKSILKHKLAQRSAESSDVGKIVTSSTFLTQHEEAEAELATKPKAMGRTRHRPPPKVRVSGSNQPSGSRLSPQRPPVPPSVRNRPTKLGDGTSSSTKTSSRMMRPTVASGSKTRAESNSKIESTSKARNARSMSPTKTRQREKPRADHRSFRSPTPRKPRQSSTKSSIDEGPTTSAMLLMGSKVHSSRKNQQATPKKDTTGSLTGHRVYSSSTRHDKPSRWKKREPSKPIVKDVLQDDAMRTLPLLRRPVDPKKGEASVSSRRTRFRAA